MAMTGGSRSRISESDAAKKHTFWPQVPTAGVSDLVPKKVFRGRVQCNQDMIKKEKVKK